MILYRIWYLLYRLLYRSELAGRRSLFFDLLIAEADRAVLTFLNLSAAGDSLIAQSESEEEARERIMQAPRLPELSDGLRKALEGVALHIIRSAIVDARNRLMFVRNRLLAETDLQMRLLDYRAKLTDQLRPALDAELRAASAVRTPLRAAQPLPEEDEGTRRNRIAEGLRAAWLAAKACRVRIMSLASAVLGLLLVLTDAAFTSTAIRDCFDRSSVSAGYFPLLTFGWLAAIIWGAHEIPRRPYLGSAVLAAATVPLGWLRVCAGAQDQDISTSSQTMLALLAILPVPLLPFISVGLFTRAQELLATADGVEEQAEHTAWESKVDRLLREDVLRGRDAVLAAKEAARRTANEVEVAHLRNLEQELSRRIDQVNVALARSERRTARLLRQVSELCLEGLRPSIRRLASMIAEESMKGGNSHAVRSRSTRPGNPGFRLPGTGE
ncbi:MAG: hypothetical protein HYX78_01760 [Armatimonadetes bacterium]|nr:hypothetical protein [Armatimonadota bacterium]